MERQTGRVIAASTTRQYVFIEAEAGTRIFAHFKYMVDPLGHSCTFILGTEVAFDRAESDRGPMAQNVRMAFPDEIDLTTHREDSVVCESGFTATQFFCKRACDRCWISGHVRNVTTEGIETLKPGTKIRHGIRLEEILSRGEIVLRPDATEIEIYMPELGEGLYK